MKILTIDCQKLILLSLEKNLSAVGYEVATARTGEEGIEILKTFKPDLVTVDVNMSDTSGLDAIKYIKEAAVDTKVLVISGGNQEDIVEELFEYGIDDYIEKPATLSEIIVRVNRLVGMSSVDMTKLQEAKAVIRQKCIGVVIPCYNEEDRLMEAEFINFVRGNLGYHLCFVNDGSTDNTLKQLNLLKEGRENYISVFDCPKNGGKAEAVRQGILHLTQNTDLDLEYIGFLDADLSTDFNDFEALVRTIERSDYKIVSGSRITRMGANIHKQSARQIISLTINFIIQKILGMNFKDTQCGAKVMHKDVIPVLFRDKFITRWLFDVEMFLRLKKRFGARTHNMILEQPLHRWIHADGSKLSMKDSLKIAFQLTRIATHYR